MVREANASENFRFVSQIAAPDSYKRVPKSNYVLHNSRIEQMDFVIDPFHVSPIYGDDAAVNSQV